ncbi:MAG: hypothetical protein PF904_05615 [Kiritimatiellae bacterium]|jgi:hypothetical protein|nr:hypothetical protein [Kiritimatiellia bacterium]
MKTLTAVLSLFISFGFAQGRGNKICFEAESAQRLEDPVCILSNNIQNTSGNVISIKEGAGNPPKRCEGLASYTFDLPTKGSYTLWCRVWWGGECSNSFTVKLNNAPSILFGEDATYKAWHWVKYPISRTSPKINLKAGRQALTIENREDGIMVDQIILSSDKRFVPVDIESTGTFK